MNIQENNEQERNENQNDQPVQDDSVDNSNTGTNKDDADSEMERYDQASRASEASFTLEVEKGITPDPDSLNSETEREENNLKK